MHGTLKSLCDTQYCLIFAVHTEGLLMLHAADMDITPHKIFFHMIWHSHNLAGRMHRKEVMFPCFAALSSLYFKSFSTVLICSVEIANDN